MTSIGRVDHTIPPQKSKVDRAVEISRANASRNKAPLVIGAVWLLQRVQASKVVGSSFIIQGVKQQLQGIINTHGGRPFDAQRIRDLRQSRTAVESSLDNGLQLSGYPLSPGEAAVQPQLEPKFQVQTTENIVRSLPRLPSPWKAAIRLTRSGFHLSGFIPQVD
ncbi:predicted protein [Histoplasma capsulatum G186AR]|uniref:Uncharacterized protein n=1 Tax=Ajellomyces capsulatus (strain G186AR / H82 / ATCC MYA-2454 / RMSCC 2432) TaxID=447093 RepID=C0P0Z3_AJECG|nr:uncharacterized protein HCBG_09073 [Histoplasma capsulatum G186AR]EEH02629.1 predicted protein [Histoplasma capsulatum G186AR]